MITKGILKSISQTENTCTVRIPLFEGYGSEEVILNAIISIQPGAFNGYKEEDVVMVAFENNKLDKPVVIGKLFLGTSKEGADPVGVLSCSTLKVADDATLPLTTKLNFEGMEGTYVKVSQDYSKFKSLTDIIDALQVQDQSIQSARDDAEKSISARISKSVDASTTGFGWNLTDKAWTVQTFNSANQGLKYVDIFKVDASGVTIRGNLKIEDYPFKTELLYINTESPTSPPALPDPSATSNAPWNTIPSWDSEKYTWQTQLTYSYEYDSTISALKEKKTYSNPVCITGAAGKDGASAITSVIESSAGTNFKKPIAADATTTLTAHLYAGTTEINENNINEWYYEWYWLDNSSDTPSKTVISRADKDKGKHQITLFLKDLENKSVYFIAITDPDYVGTTDESMFLGVARLGVTALGKK